MIKRQRERECVKIRHLLQHLFFNEQTYNHVEKKFFVEKRREKGVQRMASERDGYINRKREREREREDQRDRLGSNEG